MNRGEIRPCLMSLPDRSDKGADPPGIVQKLKHAVILQSYPAASETAVVLCSTLPDPNRAQRGYEVFVGPRQGFDHATVIDCRWVFTVQKRHLRAAEHPPLRPDKLLEISEALIAGLQI